MLPDFIECGLPLFRQTMIPIFEYPLLIRFPPPVTEKRRLEPSVLLAYRVTAGLLKW
jgi:hypothetical protein